MKTKLLLPVVFLFMMITSFSTARNNNLTALLPDGTYAGKCIAVWEDVAVEFKVYVDGSDVVSAVRVYDNQVFGASGYYYVSGGTGYVSGFNASVSGNLYWYTGPLSH